MKEFEDKSLEQLQKLKNGMECYKQGTSDTFKIIEDFILDLRNKNNKLWDEKIKQCEEEIRKKNESLSQ